MDGRMITGYLAAEGFEDPLRHELGGRLVAEHGRLLLADTVIDAAWAANTWFDVQEVPIESIGDAATKLKAIQRNWVAYAPLHHRRASLITGKLPHVSAKPPVFGAPVPAAPLGSFRSDRRRVGQERVSP